jgi:hypothetical protein
VDVNAPFFKHGLFGDEVALIVAFLIGIGFGWFLERAGFGSARKLVAQFYLTDLAVFKVMFTAILTAMLGLHYLGSFGLLDLDLVYLSPTYLLPQVVGGLILGMGFVVGGYCPGTGVVAAVTGRVDGLVMLVGIVAGILAVGEAWPALAGVTEATAMGPVTLPAFLGLDEGVVVLAVVLMAVAGFWVASRVERWRGKDSGEVRP